MGKLKNIADKLRKLGRQHRISMHDINSATEEWHVILSPLGIIAGFTALVVFIFAGVLILLAYTPVADLLPGYKTEAIRSREFMMENIMRVDSLERIMNDMMAYNENIAIVVGGRTPAVKTSIAADSLYRTKGIVPPSAEDSLLRAQMLGDTPYNLQNTVKTQSGESKVELSLPVDGIVTDRFDIRNGVYGIRLATASMAQVTATAEGTVMLSVWTPDKGYIVQIQHPDGIVSVYSNLHQVLVSQGQVVRGSEVLGYTADQPSASSDSLFEFQLWVNGKVVDPESFIVF